MNLILVAVISLGAIGLVAAVILYVASKKFAVYEDPRIAQVAEVLPQANCGGCGFPGCAGFAAACVKAADAGSLEGKLCPAGGTPAMEKIAVKYLAKLKKRSIENGIQLSWVEEVPGFLVQKAGKEGGARQIRRLIQDDVEGPLARCLLESNKRLSKIQDVKRLI